MIRFGEMKSGWVAAEGELPSGVVVHFQPRSVGNVVRFAGTNQWRGMVVDLGAAINCRVDVGAVRVNFGGVRISFVSNGGRCSDGAFVSIGDSCTFNGNTHVIGPLTSDIGVQIGRDCLFASGISVRGSSHHGLWDRATGTLLNPEARVFIGDHVWVGDQVVVLNKARIPSGSVVAARSVVNKAFTEDNVLLAGASAQIRRHNVEWTPEFPADNGAAPKR